MKKLLPLLLFFISGIVYAQSNITGQVTAAKDGLGIPGVTIQVQGTTVGTVSDINGSYTIMASPDDILVFSFIGFQTSEIRVGNQTRLNVSMEEDIKTLEEVVIVGYGEMKKSDITGAVASVSEEQLRGSVFANVDQALQGRVAGVQVTQNSGQPGGGVSVRIRGANSITGSSEPLYVIDGIPFQGDAVGTSGFSWAGGANGQGQVNPLSTINPNDIVSIEVLKDASATAIFGSRAANGVMLITTRRGKAGEAKISYNNFFASQTAPRRLQMMKLPDYAEYQINTANSVDGINVNERYLDPSILGDGTDWQSEIFQTAPMSSHQLAVTGGTEKSTYAISTGYFSQDGTVIGSNFDRITTRINLDTKVKDWITFGANLTYANTNERITLNDGGDGVIMQALVMPPDVPVRDIRGNFAGPENNTADISFNPVASALMRNNTLKRQRTMGNVYLNLTPVNKLSIRSDIGFDDNRALGNAFHPTYDWGVLINNENKLRQRNEQSLFWIWNTYATYTTDFGNGHNIVAMAGTEAQRSDWEGSEITKINFATNDIPVLSQGQQEGQVSNGWKGASSLASYYGRLNYGYKDKYLLTVTMRADGSSKFGSENKWGFFPSMAAAWRVTNEDFMPTSDVLSDLKLRFGYGEVGNQAIGDYLFGSSLQTLNTGFGTAYRNARISNPFLRWETTAQYNAGMDLSLFQGKINVTLDVYKKFTRDMLLQLSVPSYLGGSSWWDINAPFANVGSLENKGIDLAINSVNIHSRNFKWTTDFNFTLNRNMVTELDSETSFFDRNLYWYSEFQSATRTKVGSPLGTFYGYIADGIFQDTEEILNHAVQVSDPSAGDTPRNLVDKRDGVWIGDIKYRDVNGDGVIDSNDQVIIGDPNPKFTFGFNNNFTYKGFDLAVFFYGSVGGDILNYAKVITEGQTSVFNNQSITVANNAKLGLIDPDGSDLDPSNVFLANPDATIPRFSTNDVNRNNRMSSRFLEDATFVRIQNVSLGYTFPAALTSKAKVEMLKIYVNIQNLHTFTNYSGYDPEIGAFGQDALMQNVDMGRYPMPRTFTVGANITF
ncbi:SusC/RagA family TonB-linked outer membrane protein [Aquiflexum sp.]|uniref:SusC/RagA family TonB-linked outer membrane protein n=1 Tax=Aquiflexum sp. TaxID=1872584 RepID=UPI0035946880